MPTLKIWFMCCSAHERYVVMRSMFSFILAFHYELSEKNINELLDELVVPAQ